MSLSDYHEQLIATVAHALGGLNHKTVYVGGAVVGLYANDPAAPDVRPTDDIDITLEITSLGKLEELRQKLTDKGFTQSPEDKVTCRFRFENIKVDVMATQNIGWAPANPWFKPGFEHLEETRLDEVSIQILSLPYFLASKLTAFRDRSTDPRTSHDLEDVIYVLDNRTDLVKEIIKASGDVFNFLSDEFERILNDEFIREAVFAHLRPSLQAERFELIEDKLQDVIESR